MAASRPWTIEDSAIARREEDRFDHLSVAKELAAIVQESTEPLAIGLLGPFGTGKSSVVKLLAAELAVNRTWAVLHVSAEHHSGTARARGLLHGLLGEARRRDLISEDTCNSERACLEGGRQHTLPRPGRHATRPGKPRWTRYVQAAGTGLGWVGAMLIAVWLIGAVVVGVGHLAGIGHNTSPWTWFAARRATELTSVLLGGAVVAGVIGAGKDGALQTLKAYEITVTSPRPDATDDLERVFSRLIDHVDRRLVIAIDDIDRLAAADVLEALATVRSMLLAGTHHKHRPVFVLSCDEAIVREAIMGVRPGLAHRPAETPANESSGTSDQRRAAQRKATEEAAQEYLNKLFTVRMTLPAHHDSDLRGYAEHLLLEPEPHPIVELLGGPSAVHDILDTLIHRQVRDPRHAIRLLNTFLTDYRLAQRREQPAGAQPPRIAPGEVTGHPVELARLTVLRHDFRELYDRIQAENDLLHLLDDALLGIGRAIFDPLLEPFVAEAAADEYAPPRLDTSRPGLVYLRATAARARTRRAKQLGALITLGSGPASRLLGSEIATAIQAELVQRDSESFLTRLADIGNCERVLRAACETIDAARPGQDLDNVLAATAQALGLLPDPASLTTPPLDGAGRALAALTDRIARRHTEMTSPLPARDLVYLLDLAEESHTPQILAVLKERPENNSDHRPWAQALLTLPSGPRADALAPSLFSYFVNLSFSGTSEDLTAWITAWQQDPHAGLKTWPSMAYGALLAMAARHDDTQAMEEACRITVAGAAGHQWHRSVVVGVLPGLSATASIGRHAVNLLHHTAVPADGWGIPAGDAQPTPDATLAAQLTEAAAAFLIEDELEPSAVRTADLLHAWLPSLGSQISPEAAKLASAVIADAIAQSAETCEGLAQAVGRILPDLPATDAAACATTIAGQLQSHRNADDRIGTALRAALVDYLHHTGIAATEPRATASETCLSALTASLEEDSPAGKFARAGLPALLATAPGRATADSLTTRLTQAIPVPGPGHINELLGSIHLLLHDQATRAAHLPAVLARLQQCHAHGQPTAPLDFATRYAAEPAVDTTWLTWIAQHWAALSTEAQARAVRSAARPELRQTPLPDLLAQHLLTTDDATGWEHTPDLWDALTADRRADLLARAHNRCPQLADHAAQSDVDLLHSALIKSKDDVEAVLKLITSSPQATTAITRYVEHALDDAPWHPDRARSAAAACPQPDVLWDATLDAAATSLSAATRAATIIEALTASHPDTVPSSLADRLAPVLYGADDQALNALGTALRPMATTTKRQVANQFKSLAKEPEHLRRVTAFRKAAGLLR